MKFCISILLWLVLAFNIRAQSVDTAFVNKQVAYYCNNGQFGSASLLLVQTAKKAQDSNELKTALIYQIRNCELVEQKIDYFIQNGFTLKDFFSNYGMVFVLQRDLGQKKEAIQTYLDLSYIISKYAPNELLFYTDLIASTLGSCKDSIYADSVYCLQRSLDIIKQQEVNEDNVKKYLWYCRCFNMNRMYNSFDNKALVNNRIEEIESWYERNYSYIHELDTALFKKDILEYDLEYADLLYLFAGAIGAQKQDLIGAIELYHKEISLLSSIEIVDTRINLKIASCYARIANNYYQLGNLPLCKQYCDKAYPFMFNQVDELEYCDVLSALANIYYNTDQAKIAAKLKLNEIRIRERVEGYVSLTDWSQYFLYIVGINPEEVILQNSKLSNIKDSKSGKANYYLILGKAYSCLMDKNTLYKDFAETYFHKVDSILLAESNYYEKFNLRNGIMGNLYAALADHYSLLNQRKKSYEYSIKALQYDPDNYYSYYKVALKSALLHDIEAIHKYLPRYYYGMGNALCKMLPILGSVESDVYLGNGDAVLYHIPEWASWNPTDSVSVCIAYDAALLMKGLTLRYNVLSPYYDSYPGIKASKLKLDILRDSIHTITDDNARLLALHRYELKEREVLKEINDQFAEIHWQDIKTTLNNNDVCIEFVKYTANAYSWSEGSPTSHYAALLLIGDDDYPVFVDLFDEKELKDVYTLQPKSYDTEAGIELYDKLWGKLDKYIVGKRRVFFSPMGLLNLINIEALKDGNGRTALETYNLSRVSSTRQLLTSSNELALQSIVSFGGIDYTKMEKDIIDSLNTRGNWNYLKNTLDEVLQVEKSLQERNVIVSTITGSKATEAIFKSLDGTTNNIIHIASHGFYIPVNRRGDISYYTKSNYTKTIKDELFYSGLIMSGGQSTWIDSTFVAEKNDGILTSYEISKLDLHNVELVVLSACETGLGDNLFDGIFGLQRAFKKAGAKSILMSLWNINDKATSEYMGIFYSFLSSGLSKQESYKRTVAEMKKKYDDPFYWASFVMLD